MKLQGVAEFISKKSGIKKDGSPWFLLKFLDNTADEFFTAFVDEKMFNAFDGVGKRTEVALTFELVPGQKYFSVTDYELNI